MTLRGRLTLLAGVSAVGLAAGLAPNLGPGWVETEWPWRAWRVSEAVRQGSAAPEAPPALLRRLPVDEQSAERAREAAQQLDPGAPPRLVEWVDVDDQHAELRGPLRIEYSLDAELTGEVFRLLRRGRVRRGHVILLDPRSGRVLAYASTDTEGFPATRNYPAASLIKVVTAAAALNDVPEAAKLPCRYTGSPYRLTRKRLRPPSRGHEISLTRALATSNNQCFAQLAVNSLGRGPLLSAIRRFGWLEAPAPGHDPGRVELGDDDYELGRLGCGLSGCRITPLHAAQLASILARGERVEPWWIDRIVDAEGSSLALPYRRPPRRVMSPELASELRSMLVQTTTRGTARSAFRDRRGRPKLGSIRVAGKTGNLSGSGPKGRYEWFVGVAPASDPRLAVAVVQAHDDLWWRKSSEIAADVLRFAFCERGSCSPELASRFTGELGGAVAPVFLSQSGQ